MATIQGVYIALFGRPADPLGLQFFNDATQNGADLTAIGDLAASAEYQSRFAGQNNTQIVNSIYLSLFGRNADAAGLAYFVAELQSGRQNINTIAINILDGARNEDLTIINNKLIAADRFTTSLDTGEEIAAYSGDEAAQNGRDFLSGVTSDPATIPTQAETDAAIGVIVNGPPGGPIGETIPLTEGLDSLVGTDANDTFVGDEETFSNGDQIDGRGGDDTLNLFFGVDADANVMAGDTIQMRTTSVENISIENGLGGALTVDMSGATGVTTVSSVGGDAAAAEDITFTELQQNVAASLSDTDTDLTLEFDNNALDSTDAVLNVEVDNAGDDIGAESLITIVTSGSESFTSLNIDSSGDNSFVSIESDGGDVDVETITATGSGTLYLDADDESFDNLDTVNASAMTGGLILNLAGGTDQDIDFTGGSGDDIVLFNGSFDDEDVVDGGAGDFDAISIDATNVSELEDADVTDVETLIIVGAEAGGISIDSDDVDFTNIILQEDVTGDVAFEDFDELTVYIEADQGGVLSFDSDDVTIIISDAVNISDSYEGVIPDVAGPVVLTEVDATGLDTISFVVDDEMDSLEITTLENGAETVTFSGDGDVTVTTINDVGEDLEVLDLTGLTGDFDSASELNNEGVRILFGDVDVGNTQAVTLNDFTATPDADDTDFLVFGPELSGEVEITNFEEGLGGDVLDLSAFDISAFGELEFTNVGTDVEIRADEFDGVITLIGVQQADLDSTNFIL